jgi:hypothetical protein
MGRRRGPDADFFWEQVYKLCPNSSDIDIAKLFGDGITHSTFGNWKNNRRYPPSNYVVNFARALGRTTEELITGEAPLGWRPPDRIEAIVDDLLILNDNELSTVAVMVHPLAEAHRLAASADGG